MNELANCYMAGCGVDQNTKEAFILFQKSASRGNTQAIFSLGNCYFKGLGVEKDEKRPLFFQGS
ncbi:MAG: sel1 repeat family protein [Parachlamydiaceae bacterium]|nr:MAG: sel1 repeat family protein [Parachlamydiaceae bacterium]